MTHLCFVRLPATRLARSPLILPKIPWLSSYLQLHYYFKELLCTL